jgi:hypothetical protein
VVAAFDAAGGSGEDDLGHWQTSIGDVPAAALRPGPEGD